jgi:hypothetical protein
MRICRRDGYAELQNREMQYKKIRMRPLGRGATGRGPGATLGAREGRVGGAGRAAIWAGVGGVGGQAPGSGRGSESGAHLCRGPEACNAG